MNKRHGLRHTPEYKIWDSMVQRCTNPQAQAYARYGGRGIAVCDEWRQSFVAFYTSVGPRPHSQLTLERIENDKGYEPGNVKWATWVEQNNNQRPKRKKVYCLRGHNVSELGRYPGGGCKRCARKQNTTEVKNE